MEALSPEVPDADVEDVRTIGRKGTGRGVEILARERRRTWTLADRRDSGRPSRLAGHFRDRLATELCARLASVDSVRFCNSGTEATMSAMRAAKAFTGRAKILKMEGGYHGSHDAVEVSVSPPVALAGPAHAPLSVPGSPGLFAGITGEVLVAPFNDVESTAAIIDKHARDLAAVIVEPVQGAAGVIPATQEYMAFLTASSCRRMRSSFAQNHSEE